MLLRNLLIITLLLFGGVTAFAQEEHHDAEHDSHGEFNASEMILHHILDSHDWHITDLPGGTPIALHLPWILISDGFHFIPSTDGLFEKGFVPHEETAVALKSGVNGTELKGMFMDDHGHPKHMSEAEWAAFEAQYVDTDKTVIDMSITKTALQLLLIGLLVLLVFRSVAKSYQKNEGKAPKGLQSFMEPIILFVRDEVARPWLHDKANAFLPYLLTLFFFIWFSNLFGLTPLNSNIMGNISVTASLAILTMILINFNGSTDYWKHIFVAPGIPALLKPLMFVVEFIGVISKPFALAVRLFANISAGHFMVLGLVSLIFIMGDAGANAAGGFGISPLSFLFTVVIFALEMIVAIVQAFIFTLLTAVFIGMAMESHDDHH
ncbi:MAG: F0F1 ATP synthase subunit A [Bacteroidota bacterium]